MIWITTAYLPWYNRFSEVLVVRGHFEKSVVSLELFRRLLIALYVVVQEMVIEVLKFRTDRREI